MEAAVAIRMKMMMMSKTRRVKRPLLFWNAYNGRF